MRYDCGNIYKSARLYAGISQEKAAELLYISTRSLCDYENGRSIPSDEVVCRMIEVYNAPWLGYMHLKHSTEVGRKYLPDISFTDLARAVLRFQKEVGDLKEVNGELIEIACDGQISEHEKPTWQKVAKEIKEVVSAAFAILFAEGQKEKALERAV